MPPTGLSRFFMLTFLNTLSGPNLKPVLLQGDKAEIETKAMKINEALAETVERAGKLLEEIIEKRKFGIPLTGNERRTFNTLQKILGLPEGSNFADALKSYAHILRNYKPQELTAAFSSFGTGEITPISILKPELYTYTRAPFMKSKEAYGMRLNVDYFMVLIAGYIFSRLGSAAYDIKRGRKLYQTIHLLPYGLSEGYSQLYIQIGLKKWIKEGGLILPGLNPEEAVILWLSLILPPTTPDIFLVGIKDPAGQNPASIGVAYHLPFSSFINRASESLSKIKKKKQFRNYLKNLLWNALEPVKAENLKLKGRAIELVKLLFLAVQKENEKERNELLLRVSRIETSFYLGKEKLDEKQSQERILVSKTRRLAEFISSQYYI